MNTERSVNTIVTLQGIQYRIVRERDFVDYPEIEAQMPGVTMVYLRSQVDDKLYWAYRYSWGIGVPSPAPFSDHP